MRSYKTICWLCCLGILAACSREKAPAEQAFAQVQASVGPVSADLEKYAPEQYAELQTLIDQMKAKLNAEDYAGVLALQPKVMSQLTVASGATAKNRHEVNKKLGNDWKQLQSTLPSMLDELSGRLGGMDAKRLPAGVTAAALAQAQAQLVSLKGAWSAAQEMVRTTGMDAAVSKGEEVKRGVTQTAALVGLRFGDDAGGG